MSRLRLFPLFGLLGALCCLLPMRSAAANIVPRVVGPVDDSSRIAVGGSLSVLAKPAFDRGEASPATELHNVRLVLQRSPNQEAALETFMAEQLDHNSPNYHHWLTPAEFNARYGLADSDVAAIKLWLQSHGLQVGDVTATDIAFSGTVPQIEEALRTSIHTFVTPDGRQFFSNTSEPTIPAAFSNVIRGVAFLNTLQPVAHYMPGPAGKYDTQERKLVRADSSATFAHPDMTVGNSFLYVVPADAATIYDTPNSYNAAFSSGTSLTGAGVTIGIGGDGAIQSSTVVSYRKRFLNGDTTSPTVIDVGAAGGHPAQANGDTDEAYLDNELAGGLAPGATIDFYVSDRQTTGGIGDVIPAMISDNKVDIFSLSFGECELYLPTATNQQLAAWWQQAAAQGITVVVSTGDDGSSGCDDQNTAAAASTGLNVSGFSTTPYNVAVGGLDYYGLLNGGFSTYVNNNSSSTNSYRSALKYIPESPWNDSSTNVGPISANVPTVNQNTGQTNIIGGTGGVSNCSTNTTTYSGSTRITGTCTSGYAKPSWQKGPGVPSDGARDVPDVSLLAANGFYGATWLVCTDSTNQNNGFPENCATQADSNFYFSGIGGTSASTPAFAGILALLVQANKGRVGMDGAKFLYDIYNSANGAAAFHDVTVGNNSVICTSGSPQCMAVGSSFFLSGYNTTAGYDPATGLGSVDATNLISAYAALSGGSGGKLTPTVTVKPASNSITTAQSLSVTVTVAGGAGNPTPTGTVTLSSGTYTSSATTLSAGSASITIPAGALSAGSDTLTATYGGDTNYVTNTGTAPVTVAGVPKLTPTVTVKPASTSIDTGQSLTVSVVVTGGPGNPTPSGTVTLTAGSYTSSPAATLDNTGSASFNIPANSFSSSGSISATYNGDGNYNSANGTATVTLTQSTFTLPTPTNPAPIAPGSSATTTITVTSNNNYSGTISFVCTLTGEPSGAVDLPTCTAGNPVTLSGGGSGTTSVSVSTTAASTSRLDRRGLPGWLSAGGGTALALLVFFGIPARRRSWRNLLGLLVALAVLGSLSACGGGSSSSSGGGNGGGGTSNPGTTAGPYTFTVTGTGNPSIGSPLTTTFTVTVN